MHLQWPALSAAGCTVMTRSSGGTRAPMLVRGMATYMLRLVWPSGYSSSASARAVQLLGLQCTGLRPLASVETLHQHFK